MGERKRGFDAIRRRAGTFGRKRPLMQRLVMFGLVCVIGVSITQIVVILDRYEHEERVRGQMETYRPDFESAEAGMFAEPIINQNVIDAREVNEDILGWVTMSGTRIDYPFVQKEDNDYYLRRDINGDFAYAGTIFMDYRCDGALNDFVTVIYGHNMKNGSMFHDLRSYDTAEFFNENHLGWLYLEDATYRIDPFAYLLVRSDDSNIYAFGEKSKLQREAILSYIRNEAFRYRELSLTAEDKLLVLSTCAYDFNKARNVVVARLVAMPGSEE